MTSINPHRPRLSVEITKRQSDELRELFNPGERRHVFSIIVDDVIRLYRKHGPYFIAAISARGIKLEEYMNLEVPSDDNH
jgi:hypothetical protein